jgi:outer membrane receptor protein involved in Fe transport
VNDPNTGNAIASFLLGDMNSGSAAINSAPYVAWHYPAAFFQDDWQVSSRLTLNLGLRWDFEAPPVERHDRQNRGFAFNTPSPIQVPGMNLTGGLLFAGVGQPRAAFNPDYTDWQPRFGAAYRIFQSKPLVFRAGLARYYLPTTEYGGLTGFSQTTPVQTTTSAFLPLASFSRSAPVSGWPRTRVRPSSSAIHLGAFRTSGSTRLDFNMPSRPISCSTLPTPAPRHAGWK